MKQLISNLVFETGGILIAAGDSLEVRQEIPLGKNYVLTGILAAPANKNPSLAWTASIENPDTGVKLLTDVPVCYWQIPLTFQHIGLREPVYGAGGKMIVTFTAIDEIPLNTNLQIILFGNQYA